MQCRGGRLVAAGVDGFVFADGVQIERALLRIVAAATIRVVQVKITIGALHAVLLGNLVPEYNGVAGSCGAVKAVGMKVAQQNGMQSAYRYFDLNNAYRCCCDNPKKCPFYLNAVGENETVNARRH